MHWSLVIIAMKIDVMADCDKERDTVDEHEVSG